MTKGFQIEQSNQFDLWLYSGGEQNKDVEDLFDELIREEQHH